MSAGTFEKKLQEARAFFARFDYGPAMQIYETLVRQFPNRAQFWLEYGAAAGGAGRLELAEQAWGKVVELEPRNSQLMLQIGHQYQNLRQPGKARAWFEKASAVTPEDINPRMALAISHEQNHSFAEARAITEECLKVNPRDDQARYFMGLLDRRENKIEDAERRLRDLIASGPQHEYIQYASRYELAEVLNRTNRFDEAMHMLGEAKSLVRRLANIDLLLNGYDKEANFYRQSTRALPRDILRTWVREFPERNREAMPRFAFLGGHPRSGTTLLEQIIGAHPEVAALDEPPALSRIVIQLFNATPQVSPQRLNILRKRYLESIHREWDGSLDGKLLLDKNPSPTSKLRILTRVFPEMRNLIALRDPRDVVISCYFQNIPLNGDNANFLTLERTARHYADLMEIWLIVREWEGLKWLETRYEDIVADLEKEGRRVTEFLGLTWVDVQARFYEKSRAGRVYSPTYHDASQPVYERAVSRWRAYEKHLAPVLPMLEPYCKALGYE